MGGGQQRLPSDARYVASFMSASFASSFYRATVGTGALYRAYKQTHWSEEIELVKR